MLMDAKKVLIIIGIIVVVAGAMVWYVIHGQKKPIEVTRPPVQHSAQGAIFSWSYAASGEDMGIIKTAITLTAKYSDGASVTKSIATVEGTCNEYPSPDADVYEHSQMIICYAAGFGDYFKVIKTSEGYLVQRKEFAEASPDYNPPAQPFKTVAEF